MHDSFKLSARRFVAEHPVCQRIEDKSAAVSLRRRAYNLRARACIVRFSRCDKRCVCRNGAVLVERTLGDRATSKRIFAKPTGAISI